MQLERGSRTLATVARLRARGVALQDLTPAPRRGPRTSIGGVSSFSETLIARSGYERDGFADVYDAYRPAPPAALLDILQLVAQADRPRLVVDLGAGTGLSTRVWAERADDVVGVEANASMLERAQGATAVANVRYVRAFAADTGLAAGHADIVACAQAFHWMDPAPVLAEAARLLRPGGVFAAYDYDVPPVVQPEVDEAFAALLAARQAARQRLRLHAGAATWPKQRHLDQIRSSGHFRFARELVCHGFDESSAERVVGLAESIGGPRALFDGSAPEVEATFARLRDVARTILGERPWPMVVCYRVRVGVK
jgi:SAM-dependent methyltransferase